MVYEIGKADYILQWDQKVTAHVGVTIPTSGREDLPPSFEVVIQVPNLLLGSHKEQARLTVQRLIASLSVDDLYSVRRE